MAFSFMVNNDKYECGKQDTDSLQLNYYSQLN